MSETPPETPVDPPADRTPGEKPAKKTARKRPAKKTAAKKAAAPRPAAGGKVRVKMRTSSWDTKLGDKVSLPAADAQRLLDQGLAAPLE